jgi:hypothetical protein
MWLGGWLAVVVTLLIGWRVVAAALAWALVALVVVRSVLDYPRQPVSVLNGLPVISLALLVAGALTVGNPRRQALRVLGRRRCIWFAAAVVLLVVGPVLDPLIASYQSVGGGAFVLQLWPDSGGFFPGLASLADAQPGGLGIVTLAVFVAAVGIGLALTIRLESGVRRRVLALAAVPGLLALVIAQGFNGFAVSSVRFDPPVLLVPVQWAVLVLLPLLTLLIGSALVQVLDRRADLIALGRTVERQGVPEA